MDDVKIIPAENVEVLPASQGAQIQIYSTAKAVLDEMALKLKDYVFDVETTSGMDEARKTRKVLVSARTGLDEERKKLNADDNERIRHRNEVAKEYTAKLVAMEEPIDALIKAKERQLAEAKAERKRIEDERIAGIQKRISDIQGAPARAAFKTPEGVRQIMAEIESLEMGADFAEWLSLAQGARSESLLQLTNMLAKAEAAEAEAKRLADQKIEQDRKQAELDAADKKRRDEEAAKELRDKAERNRVNYIRDRINQFYELGKGAPGLSLEGLKVRVRQAEALVVDESFAELTQEAQDAKETVLGGLQGLLAGKQAQADIEARDEAARAERQRADKEAEDARNAKAAKEEAERKEAEEKIRLAQKAEQDEIARQKRNEDRRNRMEVFAAVMEIVGDATIKDKDARRLIGIRVQQAVAALGEVENA